MRHYHHQSLSFSAAVVMNEDDSDLYIIPAGYYKNEKTYTIEDWITGLLIANKVVEKTNDFIRSKNNFFLKTKRLYEKKPDISSLLKESPNATREMNTWYRCYTILPFSTI